MLKYIVFYLSEEYYEVIRPHQAKMAAKVSDWQIRMDFCKRGEERKYPRREALLITDMPWCFSYFKENDWYVIALYHEGNKGASFAGARYGVEDVELLEYESYDEAYRRLAGLPWDILETERLRVRESTVEDVEDFYRIYQEPSITYYMEDLYQEKEAEQVYMKAYIEHIYGFYGYGLWTVLLKETGQVIGRAGLSVREGYDLPELGFVMDVEHQGKGYAFEVCEAILDYAEKKLEFEKAQALVDERNVKSLCLLEKLGFSYERDVSESDRNYKLFIKNL